MLEVSTEEICKLIKKIILFTTNLLISNLQQNHRQEKIQEIFSLIIFLSKEKTNKKRNN